MLLSPVNKFAWWVLAKVVSIPQIADYLIKRSMKTPYSHLKGYMDRFWVFNPYGSFTEDPLLNNEAKRHEAKYPWLPSIRVHHILRRDLADDMHDHPWDARTIILKGNYDEERLLHYYGGGHYDYEEFTRRPGDTASLKYGEYHNITRVSPGGVWTLFFTWKWKGGWGFLVNGVKVPWQKYEEKRTDE